MKQAARLLFRAIVLKRRILSFLSLFLLCGYVHAVAISDIYDVEVPVSGQDPKERAEAVEKGAGMVMDRVAGNSGWRNVLDAAVLAEQAPRLLEEYSYGYAVVDSGSGPRRLLVLKAHYSAQGFENLLSQYKVPVWGRNRPQVLVWMAVEGDRGREILGEGASHHLVAAVKYSAQRWGVPLLLPLMDLQDASSLNTSDLWGFFAEPVEASSTRYSHDSILMVRAYPRSGRWSGLWQLRVSGQKIAEESVEADTISAMADKMMESVALSLAHKYAVNLGADAQGDEVTVEVSNVTDFRAYADILKYMRQLAPVKKAEPVYVGEDIVRFQLKLNGYPEQLAEHLALQPRLRPELGPSTQQEVGRRLYYSWAGDR
ncbi:DUF2066 domain-containing protein [Hahella sp. CR1]|uniref:DUF2066 domain-containing protein n=1 Tax=unclassified Hahella TaxID=2624107 RepID=UPI002441106C|nr:DUF2066 domain-containing protein [Hahella sp. CR1]MDG9671750.1 DUF2066 domain-containing protein [Hahella sp. CR1]